MLKLLGALAAMTSSFSASDGQKGAAQPILLVAEPFDGGVQVRVVGASKQPYAAVFSLEVTSGGNRSVHRGSVSLTSGEPATLSTISLGNAEPGQWRAHLKVEPQSGRAYEQVRTSF